MDSKKTNKPVSRLEAVQIAIKNSQPQVGIDDGHLLSDPAFKRGWELAVERLGAQVTFALVGKLKDVRRAVRTWGVRD